MTAQKFTAVCRIEKRQKNDIARMSTHNARAHPAPHADGKKRIGNFDPLNDGTSILARVKKRVGDTAKRKDAVWAAEMVLTAHADFFADDRAGKAERLHDAALEFAEELWGKENVVSAMLHYDEDAPHVHIVAVPRKGDKLAWKQFIASKYDLTRIQDAWHAKVNAYGLKLERGKPAKDTGNRHTRPRKAQTPAPFAKIARFAAVQGVAVVKAMDTLQTRLKARVKQALSAQARELVAQAIENAAKARLEAFATHRQTNPRPRI
jgi:hypothetical protein